MFRRTRKFLGTLMPAGLAGAFLFLAAVRVNEPAQSNRFGLLLVGWLYGIGVLGLIRLFHVAPWCYPWVGLVAGPVPLALFLNSGASSDERAGLWLGTALVGFLVGLIEWGRVRRACTPAVGLESGEDD